MTPTVRPTAGSPMWDVLLKTGVTYRQFDYWCRVGWVVLEGSPEPGSGRYRNITPVVTAQLMVMKELVDFGMSPRVAALAAERVRVMWWAGTLRDNLQLVLHRNAEGEWLVLTLPLAGEYRAFGCTPHIRLPLANVANLVANLGGEQK